MTTDYYPDFEADRTWAIELARSFRGQKFIILDTETTGLGDDAEIVSIAIIDNTGATLLDTLVKPAGDIPAAATAIHGITAAWVAAAPTFAELVPQINSIFDRYERLVIYNAPYDLRLMKQSGGEMRLPSLVQCAMYAFSSFYGEWSEYHQSYTWQKLTKAARFFEIDTAGAHGALADCRMTLGVVQGMAREIAKAA